MRFFDIRPGYCFYDVINLKKGELHHQHSFVSLKERMEIIYNQHVSTQVPGALYVDFLTNVLDFLEVNPHEFVFAEVTDCLPRMKE